ncbi:hypothetical protein VNI00_000633 [Paramarasmius palmivorus]|uniref:Autophagy-related protein 17 n=1 Tax=Paramarasmius palmivorus TaxID=297713 RepID=A0AAW0E9B6_9AGAR
MSSLSQLRASTHKAAEYPSEQHSRKCQRLLDDVLTDISDGNGRTLAQALNQKRTLSRVRETDARSFPNPKDEMPEEELVRELDLRLTLISNFIEQPSQPPKGDEAERFLPDSLPRKIQATLDSLADTQEEVELSYQRIADLVKSINEAHAKLRKDLVEAHHKYPEPLRQKRAAEDALHVATIEAALVKLSLMRSRCHQALYDFATGDAKMSDALQLAYESLREEAADLEEEAEGLDQQLLEYEALLDLVDGEGETSRFRQMVEDWIRTQKEMEDCHRDLRRLGWSE